MNDDEKYLDPRFNPMIPGDGYGKPLEPGEEGYDGRVPFWTAESVCRMIDRAFPGVYEIVLGPHKVVRMADGSYQVDGVPIAKLSSDDLLELLTLAKR